ncbi:hypothetical protein DSAG12_00265 [Promethearchaeum syntrophicum]|uniref:Uncharacterized protein n=1 Tax=Promethearchaeum syntrophicum TaxID=2594042 RepID=A0A5B9D5W1_9ARCH|nr:hypothetical protein [Candidatus Prometheoarchaeum syntrophicum]QEE14452.1 hypothetical protein DSAG12_00265 [Candidatus Prometheoarchaeum syntrophicum]
MLENSRSEQSVELSVKTLWWAGLIILPIMPLCLIMGFITDPNFKEFEGFVLIITIVAIFEVLVLVLVFLRRDVVKRFTADVSTRSLVFNEYWRGLRVVKRSYPFETINKFDLIFKNVPKGRYSHEIAKFLVLTFQSEKMKVFSSKLDQDNIESWGRQLNTLLQDQGGFPAENFAEPLEPHWPNRDQKSLKIVLLFLLISIITIGSILITLVLLEVI